VRRGTQIVDVVVDKSFGADKWWIKRFETRNNSSQGNFSEDTIAGKQNEVSAAVEATTHTHTKARLSDVPR